MAAVSKDAVTIEGACLMGSTGTNLKLYLFNGSVDLTFFFDALIAFLHGKIGKIVLFDASVAVDVKLLHLFMIQSRNSLCKLTRKKSCFIFIYEKKLF